jgi:hypothetical protein
MDGITLSYTNILVKETIQKTRQANIVLFPSQSLIAALYPFLLTETHTKKGLTTPSIMYIDHLKHLVPVYIRP